LIILARDNFEYFKENATDQIVLMEIKGVGYISIRTGVIKTGINS